MAVNKNVTDPGFIERMKSLAEKIGSVNALARAAGLSQSGIRRYFDGGEPSRPQLIAIARAGGVSISWLVSGEEDERPKNGTVHAHFPNKSMQELAAWINEQDDGIDYWEAIKARFAHDYPEFREWLKKRTSHSGADTLPKNKSVNGEQR